MQTKNLFVDLECSQEVIRCADGNPMTIAAEKLFLPKTEATKNPKVLKNTYFKAKLKAQKIGLFLFHFKTLETMKNKLRKARLINKYFSIPYTTEESIKKEGSINWRIDLKKEFENKIEFSFISIESENLDLIIETCMKEISIYYFNNFIKTQK